MKFSVFFTNKMTLFAPRLTRQEQIIFVKRLSILVRTGVPILEALKILQRQSTSRRATTIYDSLVAGVENGQYLAANLAKFKNTFGDFAVNIVRVGEASGTLFENLEYLAKELQKSYVLRRKVRGALIYPMLIVVATLGIVVLLVGYIFPKILPIFKSVKYNLPWSTKSLIWMSDLILNDGLYLLAGLIVIVVACAALMRKPNVRVQASGWILRIPVIGSLMQNFQLANCSRTIGLLLNSNVLIVEALQIAGASAVTTAYGPVLNRAAKDVSQGERLSELLSRHPRLFPPLFTQMLAVGETSGRLTETLLYLAEMYEEEVDDRTKNLSTLLEPSLLITMGLIVGYVAISIITPIYGLTQNIHP